MGKFSNVLFASDFDHTLTGMDHALVEKNIDAIRYFMSEGGIFTVASGRSIPLFRPRSSMVPVNAPCILYNGAACYDYRTETLRYVHPMRDDLMELVEAVRAYDPGLSVEIQGVDHHYSLGAYSRRDEFIKAEGLEVIHPAGEVPKPWIKLVVCPNLDLFTRLEDAPEAAEEFARTEDFLRSLCGDSYYVTRSMPFMLEAGDKNCSKGKAARELAKEYGRELLVCAGDAPNDASMLEEADFAFVPRDHEPSLQIDGMMEVASCNQGAVADAIARLEALI